MDKRENKPQGHGLGDIMRAYAGDILHSRKLCPVQLKAIREIMACRTDQMKGHLAVCDNCGNREQAYNSCRNRHCNKCQYIRQTLWVDKLKGKLLPGKYFHLVFTVPDCLNPMFYLNQQTCYGLLFKVAWSALKDLCANPRFLGAQPGAVAVLHTWSSTLTYHPHIHLLVPAGGLSEDGMEWARAKQGFLVPVKVLSKIYRARFCKALDQLIKNKTLDLPQGADWKRLGKKIFSKQWVVYAKKTGRSADHALEYLGRYTNRVAISNQRIRTVAQGQVTFRYKDPKTGRYNREMTLTGNQFVHRFLQHILPAGFYKIRYFGVLAAINSRDKKQQCLSLIAKEQYISELEGLNAYEAWCHISGNDPLRCKKCKTGQMKPFPLNNTA